MPYPRPIAHLTLTPDQYDRFVASPYLDEALAGEDAVALVVVAGSADRITPPGSQPVVVCWVGEELGGSGPDGADLVVGERQVDRVVELVARCPLAAVSLVTLLRVLPSTPPDEALALESAAYSMLQAGPEFAAWRDGTEPRTGPADESVVRVARSGPDLVVELDRPARHNAVTAQLRDELSDALAVARIDDSVERVMLRGRGPSFCSGGDLAEFGARPDPVVAHRTRLARSPARALLQLSERVTARVHGATLGGGLEMAAFARRVVAHPDTRFGLPEIGLGLVPGAGGTVSVTARAGRQRTAALALAVDTIDTVTARRWGLVDEIDDRWQG